MTLDEARFALDRMLLERHAEGLPTYIQQIDCEECEDDVSIMAYCYFIGDPDPITILFDHWACSEELLREPEATIH
jgi:hypothetical protein